MLTLEISLLQEGVVNQKASGCGICIISQIFHKILGTYLVIRYNKIQYFNKFIEFGQWSRSVCV